MTQPIDVSILFDEPTHTYLINNVKARTSVTSLIDRQVFKTNWAGVDPVVLQRAAQRGTNVHKDLELFLRDGREPETPCGQNFKTFLHENEWEFIDHKEEFKVAIEWKSKKGNSFILAGTADLFATLKTRDFQAPIAADHKTTSVVNRDSVRWQLSLLDYMARNLNGNKINGEPFEYTPAEKLFCFHFNKQAQFTPIEVTPISDVEIERLLEAEADGEEYFPIPQEIITPRQQEEILSIEQQIVQLEQTKKALETRKKELTDALLQGFEKHTDITSIKTDSFTISYVKGRETKKFDEERFITENPDIAQKYQKSIFDSEAFTTSNYDWAQEYIETKTTKASVRITLSKELKENIPLITTSSGRITVSTPTPQPSPRRLKARNDYFN